MAIAFLRRTRQDASATAAPVIDPELGKLIEGQLAHMAEAVMVGSMALPKPPTNDEVAAALCTLVGEGAAAAWTKSLDEMGF